MNERLIWRNKFRDMTSKDLCDRLRWKHDDFYDDLEMYGLLGAAYERIERLENHRDQLKGYYDEISDALGVGGANYGDVLERIRELVTGEDQ